MAQHPPPVPVPISAQRAMLHEAAQMLPKGYCVVSKHFVGTARDLIDGPPGPHVSQKEAVDWEMAMRVRLAEQLALMPRE